MSSTPLEDASAVQALNFTLPQTHQLLRDSVRRFAESEIAPLARQLDKEERFSAALTRSMGEFGLFGVVIPGSTAAMAWTISPTPLRVRKSPE